MSRGSRATSAPKKAAALETGVVVDLTHEAEGVVRGGPDSPGGKTVFVAGALPGERVSFRRRTFHKSHDEADLVAVLEPSPSRVAPRCAHFGVCGGCALQHLDPAAQLAAKQKDLASNLERIGNVNLVKVSSIVPPDVDIVDLPHIKPGAIVPTAYAAMTSETPGETIAAAVGYALPQDRTKAGVIMEYHGRGDRASAEAAVRGMLAEALAVRGERIREVRVVAAEHRVRKAGCAVAAIPLLSEEDLL